MLLSRVCRVCRSTTIVPWYLERECAPLHKVPMQRGHNQQWSLLHLGLFTFIKAVTNTHLHAALRLFGPRYVVVRSWSPRCPVGHQSTTCPRHVPLLMARICYYLRTHVQSLAGYRAARNARTRPATTTQHSLALSRHTMMPSTMDIML